MGFHSFANDNLERSDNERKRRSATKNSIPEAQASGIFLTKAHIYQLFLVTFAGQKVTGTERKSAKQFVAV